MIETDKYKKGVMALMRKASEINPQVGNYQTHYLNSQGHFIVQLSNGKLEIDLNLARESDENPERPVSMKLRKAILAYWNEHNPYTRPQSTESKWNKLFMDK